jgi:hypothetical protein
MGRLERHIATDPKGFRASVRILGVLYQKRFPPETPIQEIRTWLLRHRLRHGRATVRRTGRFADNARSTSRNGSPRSVTCAERRSRAT